MDENESLDTLFAGLAVEPVEQRSPFKFLDAYGLEDRALFFGRDNEIRDLYARFYRGQVLLVYGESGTGKTSLIQCGLRGEIPAEEALFVTVRTAQAPFEAVRRALHRILGSESEELELGSLLRAVIEQKSKTLVLVFDQFEEYFLFQPARVRQAFARAVGDGLNQNGNLRLVIGLREEYLARATELEPYWLGLFRNRLWIRHLARTDAEAAIVGPCGVCGVALEDGLVPQVLADLSGDGGEVELPILQVVLDSLYRKALAENPEHPRLTRDAYRKLGQVRTILGRFLEERVRSYGEATEAARQILKTLVTAEGTRQFGKLQDITIRARQFGPELADDRVAELLQRLIGDRLVREDPDQHWYELRHDALAQQIRQWLSDLEQELVDLRQTLENRLREYHLHGRLLEADLLAALAPYEHRLALRGELAELVELSKRRARRRKRLYFLTGVTLFAVVTAFGAFSFAQWQEAKRQKTQAEAHFKRAREAVDELTQASESPLLHQPRLEPLRRQLLEKALNYYQDLAQQRAEDPGMRAELAAAAFRTGNIRWLLGDRHGAEEAYGQAILNFEMLARDHPEVAKYQYDLAGSYNNLGNLRREIGDAAGGIEANRKALELQERQILAHPGVPDYQHRLANSYNNLGNYLSQNGDAAEARTAYRKAIALEERLAQDHPEVPAYQHHLASIHFNLGNLLGDGGDAAGARAAYQKTIELQEKLAQAHPEVPEYQSLLARVYNNLSNLLDSGGDAAGARETARRALELFERLAREHPEVPEYQSLLARSYFNFGRHVGIGDDTAGAQEAYRKALEIQEPLVRTYPEVLEYQFYLADSYHNFGGLLADTGDTAGAREVYQKALGLWERLARAHPDVPEYQSRLARSYNNLGNLLGDGGNVAGGRDAHQQAEELLERLVETHPEVPDYQDDLATSYYNLGNLLRNTGDAAGARTAYQRAIALREGLARDHPEVAAYRNSLASSHFNLGNRLGADGDAAGAGAAYQKAIALWEGLARDHPEVAAYRNSLASSHFNLGNRLGADGDAAGAGAAYQKAIALWEGLARESPDRADYRTNWAAAEGNLAWTDLVARHPRAAISAASRGLEADPHQVAIRTNLAHGYLFDNQYAKALAIYNENKDMKLPDGKTFAEAVLADFQELRAKGVDHPDMAKIEQLLCVTSEKSR